jgi:4-diphosphocytidyl-2-C-methyl-D-erythritol kinase
VITERARAKINLTLEVLARRADGYHELASLMAFADDAFDIVTLDLGKPVGVSLSGPFSSAIDGDNIAERTIALLVEAQPKLRLGAITIEKHLPVAAGIGGGSADAAAVLRAAQRANPDIAEGVEWNCIAHALGADVPVCFADRACWVTGIGEKLMPLARMPELSAVLVNPMADVPPNKTAQVFKQLNLAPCANADEAPPPTPDPFADTGPLLEFMTGRGNHLERPATAVMPEITNVLRIIRQAPGCRFAGLSGAGPTCFGIFSAPAAAIEKLQKEHPGYWIKATSIGT